MTPEIMKIIKENPGNRVTWWVVYYTIHGTRKLIITVYKKRTMDVKEFIYITLE